MQFDRLPASFCIFWSLCINWFSLLLNLYFWRFPHRAPLFLTEIGGTWRHSDVIYGPIGPLITSFGQNVRNSPMKSIHYLVLISAFVLSY